MTGVAYTGRYPIRSHRTCAEWAEGGGSMIEQDPGEVARQLTIAQRRALSQAQEQLFGGAATVIGHGMTMRALRQRGIVRGAMPYAYVTPFGRRVMAAALIGTEGRSV